jgi:solute carrier family 35 protein F5
MNTSSLSSSYSLGLFFIFLVAVIWSIASIVVQYLYTDQHFDSPFLLTYIGTSLFILLLISHTTWERRHTLCYCNHYDQDEHYMIPWRTTNTYQQVPSAPITTTTTTTEESISLQHVQIEPTTLDDMSTKQHITTSLSNTTIRWSHQDHFKVACKIAPVWFIANWAYNHSLAYTSITSSTVLASTGSLFTFLFAVMSKDESYTTLKLLGVLLGVTGSILTGLHDVHNTPTTTSSSYNETTITTNGALLCVAGPSGTPHHVDVSQHDAFASHAIWGDALGLLSAVGYGAYAVMIRLYCPHEDSEGEKQTMSMQLLLGYIGLVNAVSLSPVAIYILLFQDTTVSIGLTWIVFGYLVAKGMLDNVLSDYLWARAVVLTSATVATVGLGLTIPLAFVSDLIMGHGNILDATSIMGAIAVLAGFILVNIGEETKDGGDDDEEEEEEEDSTTNTNRDSDVTISPPTCCLESEMKDEGL